MAIGSSTDLNIKVNAQNNASGTLNKVKQDIGGLDKAAGTAAGGIGGLGKALGAAGLVVFASQVASATIELAKLGSQSIALRSSMESIAGGAQNAANVMEALRTASRGTIADTDLMLAANRAMLLGVADTADEMSKLLEIAGVRGRAMGLSMSQAFNDIVTGLGRMSPMILDNLGIVVDQAAAQEAYAATLGKTVKALTDAEKKQALVNAVIESSAGLLDEANQSADALAGQGFAKLDAAWKNFTTSLGESLAPGLDVAFSQIADFVQKASDELAKLRFEDKTLYAPQLANRNLEDAKKQLADLQTELLAYTQNASTEILDWADILGVDDNAPEALQRYQDGLDALIRDTIRAQEALDALTGKQQKAAAESAKLLAAQSNLGALSDATNPALQRTPEQNAMSGLLADLQSRMELYRQAKDAYQYAVQSGNDEAAANAQRIAAEMSAAINSMVRDYNALAKAQGEAQIQMTKFGTGEFFFQTAESLAAAKQEAENLAASIELIGESGKSLDKLYDTLLDTGNIEGAAKAYAGIRDIIQDTVKQWLDQGRSIEEIQGTLLPKLISELNDLIGAQVDAGEAGITAGADISQGFLGSIPAIQTVIGIVNALTGAANQASAAMGKATEAGGRYGGWTPKNIRSTRPGASGINVDPFAAAGLGLGGFAGATGAGSAAGGLSQLGRKLPFLQMQPLGLATDLIKRSGGSGGGSFDNELNSIASRVKSVLSGAFKSGIDLTDILGREDAIEEPARRLADIAVRGFESPWVDYIRSTFPEIWKEIETAGDPKAAAANILKDFEAGLRPELIDKSRAKEIVRRAILGDENTAALAQEIAAELAAEMGISLKDAQTAASAALGVGGGSGTDSTGLAMAEGIVAGVKDANVGSRVAAIVAAGVKVDDNMAIIYTAGQTMGLSLSNGMMESFKSNSASLVSVLVALIMPSVQAAMATQNSRTAPVGGAT